MRLWVPCNKYTPFLEEYLEFSKYEVWYYEVTVSANIILDEPKLQNSANLAAIERLKTDAMNSNELDLVTILQR